MSNQGPTSNPAARIFKMALINCHKQHIRMNSTAYPGRDGSNHPDSQSLNSSKVNQVLQCEVHHQEGNNNLVRQGSVQKITHGEKKREIIVDHLSAGHYDMETVEQYNAQEPSKQKPERRIKPVISLIREHLSVGSHEMNKKRTLKREKMVSDCPNGTNESDHSWTNNRSRTTVSTSARGTDGALLSEESRDKCHALQSTPKNTPSTGDPEVQQSESKETIHVRLFQQDLSKSSSKNVTSELTKFEPYEKCGSRSDLQFSQSESKEMSQVRLSPSDLSGNSSRTVVLKSKENETFTTLSRLSVSTSGDKQLHRRLTCPDDNKSVADITTFLPLTESSEPSPVKRAKRARTFIPSCDLNRINLKLPVRVIDSHCHLDFLFTREKYELYSSYRLKHRETFPDCYEGCITIFCEPQNFFKKNQWNSLLQEDGVWSAYGCHPHMVSCYSDKAEDALTEALKDPKVIALGEIGLDYSKRNNSHRAVQKKVFRRQLRIALDHKKPLVIHCREAHEDCMGIMKEMVPREHPIHLHCFTDTWQRASAWLSEFPNLCIGITNVVTYPSAKDVHETAMNIPIERLLLETDAPYFVPKSMSRQSSHPGLVIHVAEKIAALRMDVQLEDLLRIVRQNTYRVYGI